MRSIFLLNVTAIRADFLSLYVETRRQKLSFVMWLTEVVHR